MKEIKINTEFIKLGSLLKWAGIVGQGSDAKMIIKDGAVSVNGKECTERGRKIKKDDIITFDSEDYKII